jgi:hypothetical protein
MSTSVTPLVWTILEPSVIRDAIAGRLGFQESFGTTLASGATQAAVLKQNPLDGSATEGDAVIYIGTTNGGVFMRAYDFSSDAWAAEWKWISQPSGSTEGGYSGNQGIGALSISPDGSMIAVGRGASSNYVHYTPTGPALQFGQISADGSVDWLPISPVLKNVLAGYEMAQNVRSLDWQQDGLYVSFGGGNGIEATVYLFDISESGDVSVLGSLQGLVKDNNPIALSGIDQNQSDTFAGLNDGSIYLLDATAQLAITSGDSGWDTLREARLTHENMGRLLVCEDPTALGHFIMLLGWYEGDSISHVDRLTVGADLAVKDVQSLDFSGKAGNAQASNLEFFGNYSLAFDLRDDKFMTVLVGGNQYMSNHPDGSTPYAGNGGLVSGDFSVGQASISAIFGPYGSNAGDADAPPPLIPDSMFIGAPHADSRSILYLQTSSGTRLLETDDGGIWQLSGSDSSPLGVSWSSLNAPGLHSLETTQSSWDARSNSIVQAFQDNGVSIGQFGDDFLSNVHAGDGYLGLLDGAARIDGGLEHWAYIQSQQYMLIGSIQGMALDDSGAVTQIEQLELVTNFGDNVVAVRTLELVALEAIGVSGAPFTLPSATNPYRSGDIVLAGSSSLYETFVPNWSDDMTADGLGTLELVPVLPYSNANTNVTALDVGSSRALVDVMAQPKPFFWDGMTAATWDNITEQATIWYRDPLLLKEAPVSLSQVNQVFLDKIALKPLTTSPYFISALAHSISPDGALDTLYWLETKSALVTLKEFGSSSLALYPQEDQAGAALVIQKGDAVIRLPYSTTPGLNQLVQAHDALGPTSLQILPKTAQFAAQLVVAGEHGIYISDLDAFGIPLNFEAMNIDGLPAGVQYGSAVMSLSYSADDDVLVAAVLGVGSLIYSRTGELGETPLSNELIVSQAIVPQNYAQAADKRGNPMEGTFAIQLPQDAFDQAGVAHVNFIITNADLWREHLEAVSFYLTANDGPKAFNVLANEGDVIIETLTFNDFADMRLGTFLTQLNAQQVPKVTLPYRIELLDAAGNVWQTVDSTVELLPNGSTPNFASFSEFLPQGREVLQVRAGFGQGINFGFQELPFTVKAALPTHLPKGAQLFSYEVDSPSGAITIDGTTYLPTDANYLTSAVAAKRIDGQEPLIAGESHGEGGVNLTSLADLFIAGEPTRYLASEGHYFGVVMSSLTPEIFGLGENNPPYIGIGIEYPDGKIAVSTLDLTELVGNTVNFGSIPQGQGVVLDVGNGGIFASQESGGEIAIAKLGSMQSAAGFFRVDDLFGTIDGVQAGADGYAEAALSRSINEHLDITLNQAFGTTAQYDLEGFIAGCYYASYITRNTATVQDALQNLLGSTSLSSEHVLFSFDVANQDVYGKPIAAAIPFSSDIIAFEDMAMIGSGDYDFNDIVIYYGSFL